MPIRNPTGGWVRSDADRASTFANHLKNVFQPNPVTSAFTLPTLPYDFAQTKSLTSSKIS